jgi:hypothetical protein
MTQETRQDGFVDYQRLAHLVSQEAALNALRNLNVQMSKSTMKTKVIIGISIAVAFLVGFVAGGAKSTSSWVRWHNQNVYRGYATQAFIYSVALTHLQDGHVQDGVKTLENQLDCSLFAIGNDSKVLAKQPDDSIIQSIKVARDYRAKHPWESSNAVVAARVDEVLALAK